MSGGGYILSGEATEDFLWCLEHDIAKIEQEVCIDLKRNRVIKGEVHYYNSKGEEVYK
jgi:hypothetical protein